MSPADLDAIDLHIGRNIRFHRLWRDLSQAELAAEPTAREFHTTP